MNDQGSFRDPAGFIFEHEGEIYRCVNLEYKKNYDYLLSSGLYESLVVDNLLIPHQEVLLKGLDYPSSYKILKPERIPFISYPYEWCFSQLKDAALLVLKIQLKALDHQMTLKDGSAFNVQFYKGKPIFIDTLSFEIYKPNTPWIAYRQFCQHFMAPLALMKYVEPRLSALLKNHIDGIPLDVAAKLLPWRANLNFGIYIHLKLHARYSQRYGDNSLKVNDKRHLSYKAIFNLIRFLQSTVNSMKLNWVKTEWSHYYQEGISHVDYVEHKEKIVSEWAREVKADCVWDIGSNNGSFSRILARYSKQVISIESDYICIEDIYKKVKSEGEERILPLWIDFTNPSPGIGWVNEERKSILQRGGKTDLIVMLAVIHHLSITYNITFKMIAKWLSLNCKSLIIEFVPKSDEKVKTLLRNREDVFYFYSEIEFESEFSNYFTIEEKINIANSGRLLYEMQVKG